MTQDEKKQDAPAKDKAAKPTKTQSLREKLAAAEAQAKLFREKLREEERKEREENARAVVALLRSEELESYGIEVWRSALPQIKSALGKAST